MRFRQIHLDFHTSELIPGIGEAFDKAHWQRTLQEAAVDSITCFSVCHHGWSYHPTEVGVMHPQLKFNLLRAQLDACHEIGIKVPIYLTAGVNSRVAEEHPEWREVMADGRLGGWASSPLQPGFRKLCFNTPYLDYLCRLIEEAVTLFPDHDGVFLDIINQGECCCTHCLRDMLREGYNPELPEDRRRFADRVLEKYYQRTTAAVRSRDASARVFHNSGHISPGWLDRLQYFSHLELESLPTGGWGYDHFPQSAAFAAKTGLEYLGMTGKFHSTWGEFGGLKHPNALRYECSAMLALGSHCSIGDQLHPSGKLDESTYRVIGEAYREVRDKEPFCRDARRVAEVAILPQEAFAEVTGNGGVRDGDTGCARLLLEAHIPFDILAPEMDFMAYRMLILPDALPVSPALRTRLSAFIAKGGKLVLSGEGGVNAGLGLGAELGELDESNPNYLLPAPEFAPEFCSTPFVMYDRCYRLRVTSGKSLGRVYDSYFNRDFRHFCSHQHAPNQPEDSGFDAGVMTDSVLYFAHPVFTLYRQTGAVVLRQFVTRALESFLGPDRLIRTNLPSMARLTVTEQENRRIVHLLYANLVTRGGGIPGSPWLGRPVEVIEELLPLHDVECAVRVERPVKSVTLEPGGTELPFTLENGVCRFRVESFRCHQMVALNY